MNNHQKEMTFLRQCLPHGDTAERDALEASIRRLERKERCVRRAVWLMVLLAALALAGLCYCTVFFVDFPYNMSWIREAFTFKIFCALGIASLISLFAFVGLQMGCRKKLDKRRDDFRRLAKDLLESRVGAPGTMPPPVAANNRNQSSSAAPSNVGTTTD